MVTIPQAVLNPKSGHRAAWRPFGDPPQVWLNAACQSSGVDAEGEEATYFVERAGTFLHDHKSDPFLLVVGFHEPHAPFIFPRDWTQRFSPDDFTVPAVSETDKLDQPRLFSTLSSADSRGIQAAYYSSISWMDHNVGRLLELLETEGLAENTIVIFVSDNGYLLGQHGRFEKNCFYEPSVRVPMIVRWKGHLPEGRRVAEPVELVDVVPTALDLAGLPAPPALHGRSLARCSGASPAPVGRRSW